MQLRHHFHNDNHITFNRHDDSNIKLTAISAEPKNNHSKDRKDNTGGDDYILTLTTIKLTATDVKRRPQRPCNYYY